MSLLKENDVSENERGMLLLAHVPANSSQGSPFLIGLAIATLADACERTGDSVAAAALRADLKLLYSNHPVISGLSASAGPSATQPAARTQKEPS
jgi:hypothetical protein